LAERVPVGVVGVGHLGSLHAEKYASREDVELVGVYDSNHAQAAAVAARFGCSAARTLPELLSACRAVSVAVPVVAHEAVGLAAVAAGCHVLMEKPLAASLAEGESLLAASGKAGVLLQVGHIERFNPVIRDLHHIVSHPRFVECHRLAPFAGRGTDTDVVLDVMIHDLDLLAYLVDDEVVSIDAVGVPVLSRNVDIANVRMRFRRGCVANVTASRVSLKRERKLRIFQEDTYVSMDFDARSALIARRDPSAPVGNDGVIDMSAIGVEVREFGAADALASEIDAFVSAVLGQAAPGVTAAEALDALRLAERIRGAMELPGATGSGLRR
jgi:predicted dehydrogenase